MEAAIIGSVVSAVTALVLDKLITNSRFLKTPRNGLRFGSEWFQNNYKVDKGKQPSIQDLAKKEQQVQNLVESFILKTQATIQNNISWTRNIVSELIFETT